MDSLGVSLTNQDGSIRNIIDLYTEIAYKIQDIGEAERVAVVEGLAGKYHITRLNVLLDDLARTDSLYRQIYQSSTNSAGSALRENEIYMQSLQARINLLRVEFEKLSIAIGEAFLTDTMIDFMKGASALLEVLTKIVSFFGVFGTSLGVFSATLVLVSRRFRDLTTGIFDYFKNTITAKNETKKLEQATEAIGHAAEVSEKKVGKLSKALKTLMVSTLVGVAFYAVGKAIEWAVAKLGEAREKAEEVASANKELMESYKNNANEINNLIDKYSALSNEMDDTNEPNTQLLAEYYDLQNQIGQLMPSLVTGETQYGGKLVGSADALRIKIDLLKEQLEIEKEAEKLKAQQARTEKIDVYKTDISNAEGDVKHLYDLFADINTDLGYSSLIPKEFIISFRDDKGNPIYDSPEKLAVLLDEMKKKRDEFGNADPKLASYYDDVATSIENLIGANKEIFSDADNVVRKNTSLLKSEYIPIVEEVINANNGLTESNKEAASSMSAQLINGANLDELDNLKNALTSIASQSSAWQVFDEIDGIFGKLGDATAKNFTALANEAADRIDLLANELLQFGLSSEEVDVVIGVLKDRLTSIIVEQKNYDKSMKITGKTIAETLPSLRAQGEEFEGLEDKLLNGAAAYDEYKDVAEEMSGITQAQIDDTDELLLKYEMLSNKLAGYTEAELESLRRKEDLTVQEQFLKKALEERDAVITNLSEIYPDLIAAEGKAVMSIYDKISAIQEENEANKKLHDVYELLVDGKLTAEEEMTVATFSGTKDRIAYYRNEIATLNELYQQVLKMHEQVEDFVTRSAKAKLEAEINANNKKIEAEMPDYSSGLDAVDSIIKKYEDVKKSTKESIYITNEYEQALEELNYQIEKQLNLQKQFPEHSEEYRKSLQEQIKLEKEKLSLQQKQAKELESQIASGKIQQSGKISTSSETTNVSLSGWKGVRTQGYGSGHRGIDIDGYLGERLDANVAGEVIASGLAEREGWHSSYGNIVVIKDSNGLQHLYAHLQDTLVKVGDVISAGTQIGTIGNSGNTSKGRGGDGSHLHYEVSLNGALIDPSNYINDAKNNIVTYTQEVTETVSGTQEAIDNAKSDLLNLNGDILDQQNRIADLEYAEVNSYLANYDEKKSNYDQFIENSNNRMKKTESTSQSYRDEIEKQINALNRKKSINQEEMKFLNDVIKTGGLSARAVDELTDELHELGKVNSEIDFAIEDLLLDKLESVLGQYENLRQLQDDVINGENIRIQALDTNSKYYVATLEKINKAMREKQTLNNQELVAIRQMISSGQYHGQVLEELKNRYQELSQEISQLAIDIREVDFDIVINIKTQYDEKIDDIQYEFDRLSAIRDSFDEGSGDYVSIVREQIRLQDQLTQTYKEQYEALQNELLVRDLVISDVKRLEEELEDLSIAYWNSMAASKRMTKELEELQKRQKEEIANNLIAAYKSYLQQRRDETTRALDAERRAEERRHSAVIRNYEKELDAFRKNTENMLTLLDEQDSKRTYDMDIEELTSDRSEIVGKINLLKNDDSLRAKAERKELLEQLDEIDKEIAERRYQRDLELRRNELNKKLEEKEEEIGKFIDIEDEKYEEFTRNLDDQRAYWEAHYDDLLNDERKFAEIRKQIMEENFDAIEEEFKGYIDEMANTMPTLENSMDGTMKAVGSSIRMNIIEALNEAIRLMREFESAKVPTNKLPDGSGSIIGGGSGGTGGTGGSGSKALNGGDMKVILGKYMTEELALKETNKVRQTNIRDKAHDLAAQGRSEGSKYKTTDSLNSILSGLSQSDLVALGNYVNSSASTVVITDYLQEHIRDFAARILASAARLSTGGMIPSSFSGKGIDGEGGRGLIVHPNEIINNPLDSKRLLSMANVLERATAFISPIISKLPQITKSLNTNNGDQYIINFGDVNNATMQQAENFAKEILNNIRVKKGGK